MDQVSKLFVEQVTGDLVPVVPCELLVGLDVTRCLHEDHAVLGQHLVEDHLDSVANGFPTFLLLPLLCPYHYPYPYLVPVDVVTILHAF